MEATTSDFETALTPAMPNYFAELGLELRYAIDKSDLERRYLERSKETHPDRFVNAAPARRIAALSATMALNEAYKVLKDDRLRAEHLLAHLGVVIGDREQLDPTFLMAILEAREELSVAIDAGAQSEIIRLEEDMLDRRDASLETIATLFARVEAGAGNGGENLASIKRELILLRYIVRYLEAATDDE